MMVLYCSPKDPGYSYEPKTQMLNIFLFSDLVANKASVSLFQEKAF